MAEDQNYNGDKWTEQASKLLSKCGWQKIGDENIDIPGKDGHKHGIDAIFRYEDGFRAIRQQGVFIEAKRYGTKQFRPSKINDWIQTLDKKIRELRTSFPLIQRYPILEDIGVDVGVLIMWFHDTENFNSHFKEKLNSTFLKIQLPRGRGGSRINKLFIMDNEKISKIASVIDAIDKWKATGVHQDEKIVNFYYPSSAGYGHAIQSLPILNLEYFFSKFIVAKSKKLIGSTFMNVDKVFYFGKLTIQSFSRLKEALLSFDVLNANHILHIYCYYREEGEFRKINNDVKELFQKEGGPQIVEIKFLETYNTLPSWLI